MFIPEIQQHIMANWCLKQMTHKEWELFLILNKESSLSNFDTTTEGKAISTPRSDSQVSVTRSRNGSVRKVSRKSSANTTATSYRSLPKTLSNPLNESDVSSTISAITPDPATNSPEPRPKGPGDVTVPIGQQAQLLGISREQSDNDQNSSTQKLIAETWGDILARENAQKRNLSRPDLTVTPISSVNSTLNRTTSTPSRTPSILRTSSHSLSSAKSVTFTDTVNVKERRLTRDLYTVKYRTTLWQLDSYSHTGMRHASPFIKNMTF